MRISQLFRETLTQNIEKTFGIVAEFFNTGVLELLVSFLKESREFSEETVIDNVFWVCIDCATSEEKEIVDFYYKSGLLELCEEIIYKETNRMMIKNVMFLFSF